MAQNMIGKSCSTRMDIKSYIFFFIEELKNKVKFLDKDKKDGEKFISKNWNVHFFSFLYPSHVLAGCNTAATSRI